MHVCARGCVCMNNGSISLAARSPPGPRARATESQPSACKAVLFTASARARGEASESEHSDTLDTNVEARYTLIRARARGGGSPRESPLYESEPLGYKRSTITTQIHGRAQKLRFSMGVS